MKKTLLFILLAFSMHLPAQLKFFVEASPNASLITRNRVTQITELASDRPSYQKFLRGEYGAKYSNKLGGGIAAGIQYVFPEQNISLDAGLAFDNVNFRQEIITETLLYYVSATTNEMDEVIPQITATTDNHNLFQLSIPLSISYYFLKENLSVGLGVLPGFIVASTGGSGASSNFNKAQFAIQLQLRYRFAPNWWIVGGFQEYSSKLYKPELKQSFSNLRLLKWGLKCDF
ncbi:MAG: outer membrane beta-barrel protein [Paludibacteraceae bacterium]